MCVPPSAKARAKASRLGDTDGIGGATGLLYMHSAWKTKKQAFFHDDEVSSFGC